MSHVSSFASRLLTEELAERMGVSAGTVQPFSCLQQGQG